MAASPELTGGSGTTFEDAVVAYYLTALLAQSSARGLNWQAPTEVLVQRGALGHPLDDIAVKASTATGSVGLDLQVKRRFAFRASDSNLDFFDVIAKASQTLSATGFGFGVDRVGVATDDIDAGHLRQVRTVCDWARDSLDAADFLRRIGTPGVSSKAKQEVVAALRVGLDRAHGRPADDEEVHRFFSHFLLLRFDLLDEAGADLDPVLDRLCRALIAPELDAPRALWLSLRTLAREAAGRAGAFDLENLRLKLGPPGRFTGDQRLAADIATLVAEGRLAFSTIDSDIDGLVVPRPGLLEAISQGQSTARVVQIVGQPGAGKSALLRMAAEGAGDFWIGLRSDRILAGGWPAYANGLGLEHLTPLPILREMACCGDPVLFIDGLDRVIGHGQALVRELVDAILGDPALARWRIVATLRDGGWEHVRRWLPALRSCPTATVEIGGLSADEAEVVSTAHPRLRDLLFGSNEVREIARRPFFLSVLANAIDLDHAAPSSETELIATWWAGGGYDADGPDRARRQEVLVALARNAAASLGRRARVRGLDHEAVESLKIDRVLADAEPGHTVSFAHDIFFEWAFMHLLMDAETGWREELVAAGEPPALGRPVELLSQLRFERDQVWADELATLEAGQTRSQWRRAWLIAPFSSPRFWTQSERFSQALFAGESPRLAQLLTWFQAVRSAPGKLAWQALAGEISETDAIRLADHFAAPDDVATWTRFLTWIIQEQAKIPVRLWPSVLTCAEVWQNAFAHYRSAVSMGLLEMATTWLLAIEAHRAERPARRHDGPFDTLDYDDERRLARSLRALLLGAAVGFPEYGQAYLGRLLGNDFAAHDAIDVMIDHAAFAARADASLLADLVLKLAIERLPRAQLQHEVEEEAAARAEAMTYPEGSRERDLLMPSGLGGWVDYQDWHHLAVHGLLHRIAVPSPIAEPFHALFAQDPDIGLKTVKALCNHAVEAWRELHELDPEEGDGTPLPLALDFPWGRQTFWGSEREYLLFRGVFSPQILSVGLMVMEGWALRELEAGADVDGLLRRILDGCQHNAILGVASTVALTRPTASAVTLALVTAPRLWHWDFGRLAQIESTGLPANLITAIGRPRDQAALHASNDLPVRKLTIGNLAPLFLMTSDHELTQAFKTLMVRFGEDPALDYAEQSDDQERVDGRLRQNARWAAMGDPAAYVVEQVDGGLQIQAKQPTLTHEADIQQAEDLVQTQRWIALSMWALRALGETQESPSLSDDEAIAEARALDAPDLFGPRQDEGLEGLRQAGVAGAAAFVLREPRFSDETMLIWAQDVIVRAYATPLGGDGMTFAESILSHHPLKYVPIGMAGIIRRDRPLPGTARALLAMVACYVNEISIAAARAAYDLADVEPALAAAALQLVLSLGVRTDTPLARRRDRAGAHQHRLDAVSAAIDAAVDVALGQAAFDLPDLPNSHDEMEDPDRRLDDRPWLDTTFLAGHLNVLITAPAGLQTPLNALADRLLRWTLSQTADANRQGRDSLTVWRGLLMQWMARRARALSADEIVRTVIEPIAAEEDAACVEMLEPFVGTYAAAGIHDAETITADTMAVMFAAARRIATVDPRSRSANLGQLLRDLLCVPHQRAGAAIRFANGDWSDIAVLRPIVDILLPAQKGRSEFARTWLALIEHARAHYPVDQFAAEAAVLLESLPDQALRVADFSTRLGAVLQALLDRGEPLGTVAREQLLRVLDVLADHGDRRAALLQRSEFFRMIAREV